MENKYLVPIVLGLLIVSGVISVASATVNQYGPEGLSIAADNQCDSNELANNIRARTVHTHVLYELGDATETGIKEESIPESYEITEESIGELDNIKVRRFLLWTNNGEHIMWGKLGNGYFTGEDNLGKKVWGIYHNGVFAGFYDSEFFQGAYNNNPLAGTWEAENLFGEEISYGRFVLFPQRVKPCPAPLGLGSDSTQGG